MSEDQIERIAGLIYTHTIIGKSVFPEKITSWNELPNHDRLKPICRKAAVAVLQELSIGASIASN